MNSFLNSLPWRVWFEIIFLNLQLQSGWFQNNFQKLKMLFLLYCHHGNAHFFYFFAWMIRNEILNEQEIFLGIHCHPGGVLKGWRSFRVPDLVPFQIQEAHLIKSSALYMSCAWPPPPQHAVFSWQLNTLSFIKSSRRQTNSVPGSRGEAWQNSLSSHP